MGGASRRIPAAELGGITGSEPVPVGLVAHLQRDPRAGWAVEEITRGECVLALIDNTVPARTRPIQVLDHLQAATQGVRGLRGTRGDAEQAAELLIAALA